MKNISFICCLFFATSLLAQNTSTWFPPGAQWKYLYQSISGPGKEVLELVGNEIFAGHLCAKVHQYGYHQGWPAGPTDFGYQYFYAQNDSVFHWQNDHFRLLYDFNRQAGDTFDLTDGLYEQGVIDSTGMDNFFDVPVRFQDISLISSNLPDTLHTRVYDHLGGTHFIYWDIESPLTEIQYALTCYRDDEHPKYDCNIITVATSNLNDLNSQIKLYPNPASDAFTLEVSADAVPALARLFDAQGREVARREITETINHWNIPALGTSKVLFLHVQTADKRTGGIVIHH